jgi:excisionase family DNA binding protein
VFKIEGLDEYIDARVEAAVARLAGQEDNPWYTAEDAAAYLGTTVGQVRNLRSAGKLFSPSARGTKLRFRRSELDRYASGQCDVPIDSSALSPTLRVTTKTGGHRANGPAPSHGGTAP